MVFMCSYIPYIVLIYLLYGTYKFLYIYYMVLICLLYLLYGYYMFLYIFYNSCFYWIQKFLIQIRFFNSGRASVSDAVWNIRLILTRVLSAQSILFWVLAPRILSEEIKLCNQFLFLFGFPSTL